MFRHETEGDTLALTLFVREETAASSTDEAVRRMVNASLFYGSVHLSYDAAGALAGKIGSISTRQTPDCVAITCVTTPARYRDAIYLLCEVIKNAEFSPAALERARAAVLRLREERGSDQFLSAYDAVTRSLLMRKEPDSVQLRHVTQDQAAAYFSTNFVPARTVFSAVGNIDLTAFQRSLDNNLFGYNRPGAPIAAIVPNSGQNLALRETKTSDAAGSVSYALVAVETPFIADPDYPAFCVLTTLLGGGNASRMFREIRDASGIGYSVGTALRPEDGDPMVAYVEWDAGAAAGKSTPPMTVLNRIQSQLDALTSRAPTVTDAEIERARNFAAGQYILRHERIQERCFLPGWYEMIGAGCAFDDDLPGRITAVTKDELLSAARKYLPTRAAVLRIGSK